MSIMTRPRVVVRLGSLVPGDDKYLDNDGNAVEYENAKRFKTDDAADAFAKQHIADGNYGIFPCSTPKKRRSGKVSIEPDVAAILALPPVKWQAHLDKMGSMERYDLSGRLMSWCAQLALVYGYANARNHGDDHAAAIKSMNRQHAKVRRAVGYSYPKSDMSF